MVLTDKIVTWFDSGKEPQVPPNPAYPDGVDVLGHVEGKAYCFIDLPYPAARIGLYIVECRTCGVRVACTTAGRPDDPRSITMKCDMTKC